MIVFVELYLCCLPMPYSCLKLSVGVPNTCGSLQIVRGTVYRKLFHFGREQRDNFSQIFFECSADISGLFLIFCSLLSPNTRFLSVYPPRDDQQKL